MISSALSVESVDQICSPIKQKADSDYSVRLPFSSYVVVSYNLIPRYNPKNQLEVFILILLDFQMEEEGIQR